MISILDPGPLTTVQDLGRPGQLRYGIPPSGPMDRAAFLLANRLVGNDDNAAALECTIQGPRFSSDRPCAVAVTGAEVGLTVNGTAAPLWQTLFLQPGDVVRMAPAKAGVRAYVAVAGGIDVPLVLGSRSTYLRGRMGGVQGRQLVKGDTLALVDGPLPRGARVATGARPVYGDEVTVHVVLGPQHARFTQAGLETLLGNAYEVTPNSDRMGMRLRGPRIEHTAGHDIISDGMPLGGIQIPGDGQPIVLLLDRQSAGGYTKAAAVCSFDVGRLAQVKPGHRVRFTAIPVDDAHRRRTAWLASLDAAIEPLT